MEGSVTEGGLATLSHSEMSGQEPVMCLQRPSSARSQDVRHVLAQTFRELYARDTVGMDTVNYLHQSRGSDDDYHEKYVLALKKVQEERERRLAEAAMLERHIMQAQARAMSADEKALNRINSSQSGFPDLGLPPPRAHFRSCIDSALLRKHNLITPEDFCTEELPPVPPPSGPPVPSYARDTASSTKKKDERESLVQSPLLSPDESIDEHWPGDSEPDSSYHLEQNAPEKVKANLWKKQISPEEREANRVELANLQRQVDYLKNPHHVPPSAPGGGRTLVKSQKKRPKEVGIKAKPPQADSAKELSIVFVASPPVMTFSDYTVSQVYEMTLEMKNVTTVMRPVRLIPPKTKYFSVGLGQFPSDHGLVAPGMSCRFNVLFSPDSLRDFDDELTFHTQSSEPMIIKLQGRRPPPKLTLRRNIRVGQCLVGGLKVAQYMVRNEGGTGRFCMMPSSKWPTTNFKSVTSIGCVSMPPFEVRPSVFELDYGESTYLEVLFTPNAVESYSEGLTLVCDNCQVQHFTLTGNGVVAQVKVLAMEGGMNLAEPGELCDVSAQHLVKFETLNPYTYIQRKLTVNNMTEVELPYSWEVIKPCLQPPDVEGQETASLVKTRTVDSQAIFSIEPPLGTLPPSGTVDFTITFAPPEVESFHNVLHLVLRGIPALPDKEAAECEAEQKRGITPLEDKGLPHRKLPPPEPVGKDTTVLEVEVKGECVGLSVVLQPYAMYVPGQLLVETAIKRPLMMINQSISPIIFQWESVSTSYVLEVEPPVGEIAAQCEMPLELTISGSEPGKIDHTLMCHVQHLPEPLAFNVQAEIKGPEVVIEQADINFGLVRMGEAGEEILTIRNATRVPALWSITEIMPLEEIEELPKNQCSKHFVLSEMSGELRPLEQRDILVTYTPTSCQSLRTIFELNVDQGNSVAVTVLAEVQQPAVCLKQCQVTVEDVYLNVPVCHQVAIVNKTLLPTGFHFGQVEGVQANQVTLSIDPEFGELKGREELQISIQVTAHTAGELTDVRVPCFIEDTKQPLFLSLFAVVQGLSVSYSTHTPDSLTEEHQPTEPSCEDLELNFGDNVGFGENTKRILCIRNNSAISAHFSVGVGHFVARPPTPPEGKPDGYMMSRGSQRRPMLSKTPSLCDPHTRTSARAHTELCRAMLRESMGAAFLPEPMTGILPPFGQQLVEVTPFSDMWGTYTDRLSCVVGDLEPVEIKLNMTTVGCPLQFQMVAAQHESKQPVLRFGTHVSGVGPITRQMRINNTSPYDLRLDWQMFNFHEEDTRLLDVVTSFGEPFPLKDSQGKEIVPEVEAPIPLWRQPTDYLPDTPSSTPAVSRDVTEVSEIAPLEAKRPKIISIMLREHIGEMSESPYSVLPSQLVIPKRSNRSVTVNFMPFPTEEVTQSIDCHGLGVGYISLPISASEEEGVRRPEGYSVPSLKLEMTGQVKPALLTIECTEDEGMTYHAAISDGGDSLMSRSRSFHSIEERRSTAFTHNNRCLKLCGAVLRNQTETPLVFQLQCAEPFQLVMQRSDGGRQCEPLLKTDSITLLPRHNMPIQVGFCIPADVLERLEKLSSREQDDESQDKKDSQVAAPVTLETHGSERKLHFNQQLVVLFNNGSEQKLPLYAKLSIPTLELSKQTIDFGTCFVGQQREAQFMLTNPTSSDSYWHCTPEWSSENCTDETFTVTPNSGCLNAFVTHISQNKALLRVFFTAKHTEDYEAVFLFHGNLGEKSQRLQVLGQGSYDGRHEAVVNV